MVSSGVGLEGEEKEKFNKLQLELAELSTKFSNNILDSTKEFKLLLTDRALIKGLPPSAIAFAAQQAAANGHPEATAADGPWLLTLDMPSYLPAMQNLEKSAIREQLYRAFITRASSGTYDNSEIISKILKIKTELARILGYQHHADKSLSKKMASSVDEVLQLIDMLRIKSYPAAKADFEELTKYAASNNHQGPLQLWDVPYWSERYREHSFDFKEEELRVYFPLPTVLNGLFNLAHRLFDIEIKEPTADEKLTRSIQTWHPDVRFFDIKDATSGPHIASFFLDPYSRPSEKRGGAWMDSCTGRSKVGIAHERLIV